MWYHDHEIKFHWWRGIFTSLEVVIFLLRQFISESKLNFFVLISILSEFTFHLATFISHKTTPQVHLFIYFEIAFLMCWPINGHIDCWNKSLFIPSHIGDGSNCQSWWLQGFMSMLYLYSHFEYFPNPIAWCRIKIMLN